MINITFSTHRCFTNIIYPFVSPSNNRQKKEEIAMNGKVKCRKTTWMIINCQLCMIWFLDKNVNNIFFQYKPHDIAQQIVLMDYWVFRAIKPREFIGQAWKKKDRWLRASNLLRMMNQINSICRWIQSVKERSKMIKYMILIAKTLYDYQDFSALCAVHGDWVSTPIQ